MLPSFAVVRKSQDASTQNSTSTRGSHKKRVPSTSSAENPPSLEVSHLSARSSQPEVPIPRYIVQEIVSAALYDKDDLPNHFFLSGSIIRDGSVIGCPVRYNISCLSLEFILSPSLFLPFL